MYRHHWRRRRRLLQRRSTGAARQPEHPGRQDAAVRAELHPQPRAAARPRQTTRATSLNFRVSHSFSPDFYLKGFIQYNDDRNTASFNFLWWYHYKPGSDLYVVYNQGWDTDLPLSSRASRRDVLARHGPVRSR